MSDLFEKFHSREDESSAKWILMKEANPDIESGIVPMSVADMEFELAPEITEGLKEYIDSTILGYTMPSDSYFDSVINHYKENFNVNIEKSEIIPVIGVVPAIFNAVEAYAKREEGVIIFTPVYPQFYAAIEMTYRKEVRCPLIYQDGEYHIDFDLFEQLASDDNNKVVILCSPHNPSGRIWSREELQKIVDIAKQYDLTIISDEIHADLGLFGNEVESIYSLGEDIFEYTIVLSSASKTYNIAGLQCANAIIKDEKLKAKFAEKVSSIGVHGPNMIGMKATELAYSKAGEWLRKAKMVIEENMQITKEFFQNYSDLFQVYDTKATYLAWVCFEEFCKKFDIHPKDFSDFLNDVGFIVNPGIFFGKESKYFMRINVALPTKNYLENLDRLKVGINNKFGI